MLIFITLLIAFIVGVIAIVIAGGIGISIAILSCGDVLIGIILLTLLYKRHCKNSKD